MGSHGGRRQGAVAYAPTSGARAQPRLEVTGTRWADAYASTLVRFALPSRAIAGEAIMAATTNPADKSFSVVIEHLLEKATPGTPRLAPETCACVRRIRSVDRTNIFLFARSRRGALTSDIDSSSDRELHAL